MAIRGSRDLISRKDMATIAAPTLIGVGSKVDEAQMAELNNLFEGSGLKDPQGNAIDLWDHKIAGEMRNLAEIFGNRSARIGGRSFASRPLFTTHRTVVTRAWCANACCACFVVA